MEPCLFPTLDYALEIRSDTLQTLTFLLANERESFDAFQSALGLSRWYEVLWALVLRLYTGNDTVAFRVQSRSCSGLAGEAPEDICSAEIFRFQSVSSIECCHRPLVSPEHDDPREAARRFNIKVIYGDQGHRQPYRFERTRKKRKLSQHALVERSPACARALPVDEGLLVSFEETLGRSWMHIRFNTTLYTERAVLNVGRTGRKIFQELLNDSNQLVGKIRSLSDDDLDQILAWNSGDLASLDSTLHGEISKHVKDRPDAPALHAWDGSLTYHELDTVTSNLQGHLCNLGPRIGEMVPVCFEKSLWAAVAMLGILKAGGAFVPLDPSNPLDRTKAIIKSVNARFVLTSSAHSRILESLGVKTIIVDERFKGAETASAVSVVKVSPRSPAFVLFTSGSTGQPKGVVQEHASVCTISKAYGETLHVDSNSRVLQFASYAFDVATVDIFNTLMHGGCVCMPSEYQRKNEIVKVINDMQVNWADITPSFASTFTPEDVPGLRTLVLAGEEVNKEQVERWAGKLQLINCYGPSECGGCTYHEYACSQSSPDTIGQPLPCFKLWVVAEDDVNRLVSIGVVGELVVEGPTLARGYLNDRTRTREAFIENPHWLAKKLVGKARRLYRTKDLVQQRPDGSFRFVGRSDTQIKIRGQRVELGETEYQLRQYFGTAKSMVAFPKRGIYAKQLVAVVERCERTVAHDDNAAKTFMRGNLPEYMIPSIWLVIDSIPLSTSLKVDRRRVEYLLTQLGADDTRIVRLECQDRFNFLPLLSLDTVSHETSVKVAELVASRNQHGLGTLIGHNVRLAAVGFDSIQAISLRMWIKKRFDADVPVSKLTSDTVTVSEITSIIEQPSVTVPSIELLREVEDMCSAFLLGEDTQPARPIRASTSAKAERIFLTGATGYFGRELLQQLACEDGIDLIHVLVRCENEAEGRARITEASKHALEISRASIEIWPGDLQQPRLGLAVEHWNALVENVDIIIHNGAIVRWNADYESLKKANVGSMVELLKAVHQSPVPKSLAYVSGGQQLTPSEEDDDEAFLLQQAEQASGYAQTKLVSELLVKRVAVAACGQGFEGQHRFSVIKPSYIIGSSRDGVANTTDYLWRLVAGAVEIGACNKDELDGFLDLSDVESVAGAVLRAAVDLQSEPRGVEGVEGARVVKIVERLMMRDFWDAVREAGGYEIEPVEGDRWWRDLRRRVTEVGEGHVLWPLLWMLEGEKGLGAGTAPLRVVQRGDGLAGGASRGGGGGHGCDGCEGGMKDGGRGAGAAVVGKGEDQKGAKDEMTTRMKAAVMANVRWLKEKGFPGF